AEGHVVHIAEDGRQALEHVVAHRPDLVLLDLGLPELSGQEVALAIYLKDTGLEEIPIVLVSAVMDLAKIAREVGTPYFLQKPFPLDSLGAIVRRALAERIPPKPHLR